MRTEFVAAGVGIATLLATSAQVFADCRNSIALTPTQAGEAADISGRAEAREEGTRERFRLSMDARVEDGATFVVYVNALPAGTITIALGDGQLDLDNNDGQTLPAGVDPVCSIGTVDVVDANGAVVLQSGF